MKIRAVDLALPEQVITNDDVLDLITRNSREIFVGDLHDLVRVVSRLMARTGAVTRFWSGHQDKPIDYIAKACEGAIEKSGLSKSDIDLVVFASVDRGFYEPANAYFVADCLGLSAAHCFDVSDACNGWSRALQICHALFNNGAYRTALIVNGEFPMFKGGPVYPALYRVQDIEQLEHRFPAFTLGEGAVATIVTADEDAHWEYRSLSCPEYADLCTVSCWDDVRFTKNSSLMNKNGGRHFVSYGEAMLSKGLFYAVEVFKNLSTPLSLIEVVLPHTVSRHAVEVAASRVGASQLVYSIFPRVGNLISASIPAGLSLALQDRRVKKGDIAAGWSASAGMVFSAYTFTV